MEPTERKTVDLALGRIFKLMAGPSRPGDIAEYERCRTIVLDAIAPGYSSADKSLNNAPWPGWSFGARNTAVIE